MTVAVAMLLYLHAGRCRLDRGTRNLDIVSGVNKILPLDVVRANFSFKLVPARRSQDSPSPIGILVLFKQSSHASRNQRCFFVNYGKRRERSCGEASNQPKGSFLEGQPSRNLWFHSGKGDNSNGGHQGEHERITSHVSLIAEKHWWSLFMVCNSRSDDPQINERQKIQLESTVIVNGGDELFANSTAETSIPARRKLQD